MSYFVKKLCYNKFSSISCQMVCLFLSQTLEVDIQSRQVDVDKLTKTGKRRPSSEAQNYGSLRRQKRAVSGRYLQYAIFLFVLLSYCLILLKVASSRIFWASSYIAQYPVLRTVQFQSALHFTSLTDLFTQTTSWLLWEASSHMVQLMHEGCSYTYPPLSIARYSFIQLSELEQCRVKK